MSNPKLVIRSIYDFCPPFGTVPEGKSLTQQHFKEEMDINAIMEAADRGIYPDRFSASGFKFGDFSNVSDYQTALNSIQEADEAFMDLPAKIRIRFDNNPALLLEFLDNANNKEEAIELGLIERPKPLPVGPVEPQKAPEAPKSTVNT